MRGASLLLIAACGDNIVAGESAETHSGSRLKLSWYEFADGARQLAHTRFFDTALGGECVMVEWADGVTRCTSGYYEEYGTLKFPKVVFTDAACTSMMAAGLSQPIGVFFRGEYVGEQFRPAFMFKAGTIAGVQPTSFFELRDGACAGPFDAAGYYYFDLGPQQAITQFAVASIERKLPARGRLGHLVDTTDDGMSRFRGWYDHELATKCGLERAEDGSLICTPYDTPAIEYFADSNCSELAVVAAEEPQFAYHRPDYAVCGTYYRVGNLLDGPVYQRSQDACVAVDVGELPRYRIDERPLTFASAERVEDGAAGARFQGVHYANDDIRTPSVQLLDTELGAPCSIDRFQRRCTPSRLAYGYSEYTSAACDAKVPVALKPKRGCVYGFDAGYIYEAGAFYEIGEPIATIYRGEACVPTEAPDGYQYHAVGQPIDETRFAQARLVSDL